MEMLNHDGSSTSIPMFLWKNIAIATDNGLG